jgi:hypothetical protein
VAAGVAVTVPRPVRGLPAFDCGALFGTLRLTNRRTARGADMDLAMRVTRSLSRPAAAFIHPAQW